MLNRCTELITTQHVCQWNFAGYAFSSVVAWQDMHGSGGSFSSGVPRLMLVLRALQPAKAPAPCQFDSASTSPMSWRPCTEPLCSWCVLKIPHGTPMDVVKTRVQEFEDTADVNISAFQKKMAALAGAHLAWAHRASLGLSLEDEACTWIRSRQPRTFSVWDAPPGIEQATASTSTFQWLRPPPPPKSAVPQPAGNTTQPASCSKQRADSRPASVLAAPLEWVWQVKTGKNTSKDGRTVRKILLPNWSMPT